MIAAIRATDYKDLPALAKFLVRVYKFEPSDFHFDPRLLEWKYLYPRAGWQGGRSYLFERGGEIVAHGGICPVSFRLSTGRTVSGHVIVDWAADSRTPGVGVMMYRKLMQTASTSFAIGGEPDTRKILPRIGFRHVGDASTYAAWLRPWLEFRVRHRTGQSFLRLLHGLTHPVPNRLNYLLKCPHLEMRGFILRRGARILGYFILGKSGWEGRLLDIIIDSEDVNDWADAYSAVTNAALLDPELSRIRVLATVPMLNQALVSNGYWCQYKDPIVLYDPTDAMRHALPLGFQYFDGDWGY